MKNFSAIFVLVALAMSSHVNAATKTWTGAANTNWSDASNWSGGTPGNTDDAVIPPNLTNYPSFSGQVSIANLTLNGGSIYTNGNGLTISSYLVINAGLLDAGSGQVTARTFDLNGGELIIRGNKLNLTGSGSSNVLTIDGGQLTITNTNFNYGDKLILQSGILQLNGYDFTVSGTGGKYTYKGGYVLSPGDFEISNMEIDFSGQHQLGINLKVTINMTFTGGILETDNTHFITFDNNATVTGADNQSHIVGPIKKEISTSFTNDFIFPIGDGNYYYPLQISNYNNERSQDYFMASYNNVKHANANGTMGSGLDHVSQAEYWDLTRAATSGSPSTTVKVGLYYDENENSGPVDDATRLRVAHWNGSSWDNLGRGTGSSSSDVYGWVYSNGNVSSFSPFTLGSSTSANPLPIVLLNFDAELTKNEVNVKWSTSAELNNDYFLVEKSVDGINWATIQVVKGAGTTETINNYATIDPNPVNGVQYYRLKQVDFNGKFEYSAIVPVNFNGTVNSVNIFPIPANNNLNVSLDNPENSEVKISIYNTFGQEVLSVVGFDNFYSMDITQLNSGVYTVEVVCDTTLAKTKLIKN